MFSDDGALWQPLRSPPLWLAAIILEGLGAAILANDLSDCPDCRARALEILTATRTSWEACGNPERARDVARMMDQLA